jgi:hypothetical protein|tara:strand:- start:255 stop:518 length:264 start_codon:yes stop_codon:yes gene_type:complete
MYTIPEKNIYKLPDGKIWEGNPVDVPYSQADLIAKAGHEYPTAWLKEQGWGKKKAAPKKAAPKPAEEKAVKKSDVEDKAVKKDTEDK